jgi:hypothetical protein
MMTDLIIETLQLHILNTRLSIYEHSFNTMPSKNPSFELTSRLSRIESLWNCLNTVKSWFTLYLSLNSFPLASYPYVSMALLAQQAHCIVALFRISTFESPDIPWNRQRVRQEIDFGETVKLLAQRWSGAPKAGGLYHGAVRGKEDDVWSLTGKKFIGIKNWWDLMVADRQRDQDMDQNSAVPGLGATGQQQQMEEVDYAAMNMEFWDDIWIKDLLGGGNEFTSDSYF